MFLSQWIFEIVSLIVMGVFLRAPVTDSLQTTCEEFERDAIFDPNKIIDSMWKIIYFWSNTTEIRPIIFSLIEKKRLHKFQAVVDAVEPNLGVEWHKAALMMEPRPGVQALLIDLETPGAFRAIVKMEQRYTVRPHPEPLLKLADLRLKLYGRYLGMMCCEDLTAFVLARVHEVPLTEEDCIDAANSIGLRGPRGKSYLFVNNFTRSEL